MIWSLVNKLFLNIKKCNIISFSKQRAIKQYHYSIGSDTISRVSYVRDLGILLDSSLSYNSHICHVLNNSTRVLGFVTRNASRFKNVLTFKILYFSMVRTILEFASVIWVPCQEYLLTELERVQNKFMRFVARRTGIPFDRYSHDYSELRRILGIALLKSRFLFSDLLFLFKLINGIINCPPLLALFNFAVPFRPSRNHILLKQPLHRTDFSDNMVMARLTREANEYYNRMDFYGLSINIFLANLRNLIFSSI